MEYSRTIKIEFKEWPSLVPLRLKTDMGGPLSPLRGASAKRLFQLEHDWEVSIGLIDDRYPANLEGTVVIPKYYVSDNVPASKADTLLDGASVPLPWLVSFLSFGVFRPLGIMLIASIVHDFAFKHGGLVYRDARGDIELVKIERDVADKLFYDIIRTVNDMPFAAFLAWVAVRLGWFFVKYADKHFGGKFPFLAVATLGFILLIIGILVAFFGVETVASILIGIYLLIFFLLQFTAPSEPDRDNS